MNGDPYNIDPELLAEFIDESIDSLAPLEAMFLKLETEPDNLDNVDAIFRPVHSLKGNASFFGMMRIKELAHKMENVFDLIRKKRMVATPQAVKTLLPGLDLIKNMLENVRAGKDETHDPDTFENVLRPVEDLAEEKLDPMDILFSLVQTIEEIRDAMPPDPRAKVDAALRKVERIKPAKTQKDHPRSPKTPSELPQALKTLKTTLEPAFKDLLDQDADALVRNCLEQLAELADDQTTKSTVDEAIDEYKSFTEVVGFDPLLRELLLEKSAKLAESGAWKKNAAIKPDPNKTDDPKQAKNEQPHAKQKEPDKTMRVSEKRIDSFLEYVGELVVVEEMFTYLHKKMAFSDCDRAVATELQRVIETFGALSDNLRQSILAVRKIPARNVLQKLPRIMAEIAGKTGKNVDITLEGESLNIDKSYIEILDAPLTHMARNAVDHGIETPAERQQTGKKPQGSIRVAVREVENHIEFTISDDGRGINLEALKRKAVDMGIIQAHEKLTQNRVVDLLFQAGVSTAEKVTDVSGRGVGMDVVKRNIESCGGEILIQTEAGKGATFRVLLPQNISTQIMQGFLLRVGGETYVVPMDKISESFAPDPGELRGVVNKGEMVERHNQLIPVVRLQDLLENNGPPQKEQPRTESDARAKLIMVTVEYKGKKHALLVDQIIGVQKVVVKQVDGLETQGDIYQGSAIMGDGSVAMILDVEALVRQLSRVTSTRRTD